MKSQAWDETNKVLQNYRLIQSIMTGRLAAADKTARIMCETEDESFKFNPSLSLTSASLDLKDLTKIDYEDFDSLWFWSSLAQRTNTNVVDLLKMDMLVSQSYRAKVAYQDLKTKDISHWKAFWKESLALYYTEKAKEFSI